VLGLELFQELTESSFTRFTGGGHRFEINRRLLDCVRSACSINFHLQGFGGAALRFTTTA